MSAGQPYTIMQVGRRESDDRVTVLLTVPAKGYDRALLDRTKLPGLLLGSLRIALAERRGRKLVARTVTGYDPVIDGGLLDGTPLTMNHLMPTTVTEMSEWKDFDQWEA